MTRWFPYGQTPNPPQPGDRVWSIGGQDMEWTGQVWALVCSSCDVPMAAYTDGAMGFLCCGQCGLDFSVVPGRTEPPVVPS